MNDLEADLMIANARTKNIEARLAESQRREQAAIHDIMCRDHCDVCKYSKNDGSCDESDFNCEICKNVCPCATYRNENNWQWRGPQDMEGER